MQRRLEVLLVLGELGHDGGQWVRGTSQKGSAVCVEMIV